jgi:HAD superfamily hydrolase (TIGR01450 family)
MKNGKESLAVILAAGTGSRLYPLTAKMPKSMVPVCGREILDYQINGYLRAGVPEKNIYVAAGYMAEMIQGFLDRKHPSVKTVFNGAYSTTNNMYSLYLALRKIEKDTDFKFERIFINNADCLYEEALMKDFADSPYDDAVAVETGVYIGESMKITVDGDNKITGVGKDIRAEDAAGVSVDLYKYSKAAVQKLYEIIKDFIEVKKDLNKWTETAFPPLFRETEVHPFDIKHGKWVEVDDMDDLLRADMTFCNFDMAAKKAVICDLDGTLYLGDKPIEEAVDFVNSHRNMYDFYFLTNNTSLPPAGYAGKLARYGLAASPDEICTPFPPLIRHIRDKGYKSVYLAATEAVAAYLREQLPELDFSYNFDLNEAVILTYDKELDYRKLERMSILLNNKEAAAYLCTHGDVSCPGEQGNIPDIGSMIELLYKTTGRRPGMTFGKPNVDLIADIIKKYGRERTVIAGDRLYTDKLLADNAGVDFICVLSGESSRLDLALSGNTANVLAVKNLGHIAPPPAAGGK